VNGFLDPSDQRNLAWTCSQFLLFNKYQLDITLPNLTYLDDIIELSATKKVLWSCDYLETGVDFGMRKEFHECGFCNCSIDTLVELFRLLIDPYLSEEGREEFDLFINNNSYFVSL
jgi:hypothetical protein